MAKYGVSIVKKYRFLPFACFLLFTNLICLSALAQNFSIVGNGTTGNTSTTFPAPFGNANWGARHQFFITAGELTAAGIPVNATINSLGINVLTDNGSTIHNSFQIRIYSTTNTNPLGSGYLTTNQVSSSTATNFNPVVGWNQISISTFTWDGTSNLVVQTCFNNSSSTSNAVTQWTSTLSGTSIKTRRYNANVSNVCSNTTTTATSATTRPNFRFGWSCSSPGTVSSAQTISSGNQPAPLTVSGSSGAIQWQTSTNGSTWTNISGATTTTLSAAQMGVLTSNRFYRVINTGSCTTAASSNSVLITINSVSAGSIGSNQTICSGTNPSALTSLSTATGSGNITYQWQSSTNGSTWTNISGATNVSYSPLPLSGTTQFRRQATSFLNGNSCVVFSNIILITVNSISPGSISGNQLICEGQTPIILSSQANASGSGIISYSWLSSQNGSTWADVVGVTSENYQPPSLFNTTYYRRVATSSLNNTMCAANTAIATITVNKVSSGSIGSSQTICEGTAPSALTSLSFATGSGTITYQWMESTDSNTWYNISLATNDSFQPPTLNTSKYYRRISTSLLNGLSCSESSNSVKVSVIPLLQEFNVSSIGPYLFNNEFHFDSGTYTGTLIDINGCEVEFTLNLTIHGLNTPENKNQEITIFPNPSTLGVFHVSLPVDLQCEKLKIYNTAGILVDEIIPIESNIDISRLSAGYYFLHLDCANFRRVLKLQKL